VFWNEKYFENQPLLHSETLKKKKRERILSGVLEKKKCWAISYCFDVLYPPNAKMACLVLVNGPCLNLFKKMGVWDILGRERLKT
jgi:hypothetical protein